MLCLKKNKVALSDREIVFSIKGMNTFHSHYGSPCIIKANKMGTEVLAPITHRLV